MKQEYDILSRLERLEQENKVFRFAGMLLLPIAILLFTGAAQTGPHALATNELILQDEQGHTRARLSVVSKGVELIFLDEAGRKQMALTSQSDALGRGHASLKLGEKAVTARYSLAGTSQDEWATVSDGGLFFAGKNTTRVVLSASGPDSPSIEVADSQGYAAKIGVTERDYPATGETHKSSAASLVLLGKDQSVLWSAP
jgi:hypothetical protein